MRPQRVQVFSLGLPKRGTSKEQRRYVVRWRVDGRDFKRRRKVKAEAERYRSKLIAAIADGDVFDRSTGEPASWHQHSATWWEWSQQWLDLKWPDWAGSSRKSGVEALVAFTPHLVHSRAPEPPPRLRAWLWEVGFNPAVDEGEGPEVAWLERWSLPLEHIDPSSLERALRLGTTKRDGQPNAPTVAKRRRDLLNAALKSAIRRDLLATNPMDRVEWVVPKQSSQVDISVLPSMADIDLLIDHIAALRTGGARYAAFFAILAYAGLRPSEAAALRVADLDLPDAGWGIARLRDAEPSPGTRYSGTGTTRQLKELKHRAEGTIRAVPLPPPLVERLRTHLDRWEEIDGRVFSNGNRRSVTAENYGKVWNRAKRATWEPDHVAASAWPYDLRHTAATVMLRARVPLAEVARRLGHSVDVLLRVYAGVFDDDEALRGPR